MKKRLFTGLLATLLLLLTGCAGEAGPSSATTTTVSSTVAPGTTSTTGADEATAMKGFITPAPSTGRYTEHTVALARKKDEKYQKAPGVTVTLDLPEGFSVVEEVPAHKFPYIKRLSVFGAHYIVDSEGTCVGGLGYLAENEDEQIADFPPVIYDQVWLGNGIRVDILDAYRTVSSSGNRENAVSRTYYSHKAHYNDGTEFGDIVCHPAMLCYDSELGYAVVLELDNRTVTAVDVVDIAKSMRLSALP